ncbi:MAG: DUF2141 domain-containing protein [Proteobacteria bacterium]|nr:DUF2141 domain-containing protein [Pseudomonadota bacterium]MBU1688823.1 DUF2141 domain-containing protein [Pseudomonadota bacterium]
MKKLTRASWIIIGFVLFLQGWIASSSAEPAAHSGTLRIEIDGMKNDHGRVRVALINSQKSFHQGEPYFRSLEIPIQNRQSHGLFTDLPFGEYAIKLYHDENGNRTLDKIPLLGIPLERYAFSNGARSPFGPPPFQKALFRLDSPEKVVKITVQ